MNDKKLTEVLQDIQKQLKDVDQEQSKLDESLNRQTEVLEKINENLDENISSTRKSVQVVDDLNQGLQQQRIVNRDITNRLHVIASRVGQTTVQTAGAIGHVAKAAIQPAERFAIRYGQELAEEDIKWNKENVAGSLAMQINPLVGFAVSKAVEAVDWRGIVESIKNKWRERKIEPYQGENEENLQDLVETTEQQKSQVDNISEKIEREESITELQTKFEGQQVDLLGTTSTILTNIEKNVQHIVDVISTKEEQKSIEMPRVLDQEFANNILQYQSQIVANTSNIFQALQTFKILINKLDNIFTSKLTTEERESQLRQELLKQQLEREKLLVKKLVTQTVEYNRPPGQMSVLANTEFHAQTAIYNDKLLSTFQHGTQQQNSNQILALIAQRIDNVTRLLDVKFSDLSDSITHLRTALTRTIFDFTSHFYAQMSKVFNELPLFKDIVWVVGALQSTFATIVGWFSGTRKSPYMRFLPRGGTLQEKQYTVLTYIYFTLEEIHYMFRQLLQGLADRWSITFDRLPFRPAAFGSQVRPEERTAAQEFIERGKQSHFGLKRKISEWIEAITPSITDTIEKMVKTPGLGDIVSKLTTPELKIVERLEQVQQREGKIITEQIVPSTERILELEEKSSKIIEQNTRLPDILQFAIGSITKKLVRIGDLIEKSYQFLSSKLDRYITTIIRTLKDINDKIGSNVNIAQQNRFKAYIENITQTNNTVIDRVKSIYQRIKQKGAEIIANPTHFALIKPINTKFTRQIEQVQEAKVKLTETLSYKIDNITKKVKRVKLESEDVGLFKKVYQLAYHYMIETPMKLSLALMYGVFGAPIRKVYSFIKNAEIREQARIAYQEGKSLGRRLLAKGRGLLGNLLNAAVGITSKIFSSKKGLFGFLFGLASNVLSTFKSSITWLFGQIALLFSLKHLKNIFGSILGKFKSGLGRLFGRGKTLETVEEVTAGGKIVANVEKVGILTRIARMSAAPVEKGLEILERISPMLGRLARFITTIKGPIVLLIEGFEALHSFFSKRKSQEIIETLEKKGFLGRIWYGFWHPGATIGTFVRLVLSSVMDVVSNIFSKTKTLIEDSIKSLYKSMRIIVSGPAEIFSVIIQDIQLLMSVSKTVILQEWDYTKQFWIKKWQHFKEYLHNLWDNFQNALYQHVTEPIVTFFTEGTTIFTAVYKKIEKPITFLKEKLDPFFKAFEPLVDITVKFITAPIKIYNFIHDLIMKLPSAVRKILGISDIIARKLALNEEIYLQAHRTALSIAGEAKPTEIEHAIAKPAKPQSNEILEASKHLHRAANLISKQAMETKKAVQHIQVAVNNISHTTAISQHTTNNTPINNEDMSVHELTFFYSDM